MHTYSTTIIHRPYDDSIEVDVRLMFKKNEWSDVIQVLHMLGTDLEETNEEIIK